MRRTDIWAIALGGQPAGRHRNLRQWQPLRPTYTDAAAFTLLILILLFKPAGLLGKPQVEKV